VRADERREGAGVPIKDTAKFFIGATAGLEKSVSEHRKMEIRFSVIQ